jgi:LemA protein
MSPAVIVVLVLVFLVLVWFLATYNRLVGLRNHIQESWSGIDVELKRRYDLIPNLVSTVQGYARHEKETLAQVIALRDRASHNHGSPASQGVDESALMLGLKRVFALAESYPQLRSDAHFLALQEELSITEDRIAAVRRFFNGNVREMRHLCQQFPSSLVASGFGFEVPTFFELSDEAERVVPRVDGRSGRL